MKNERITPEFIEETTSVARDYAARLDDRDLDKLFRSSMEVVKVNGFENPKVAKIEGLRARVYGEEILKRKFEREEKDAINFCKSLDRNEMERVYLNYKDKAFEFINKDVNPKDLNERERQDYFLTKAVNKVAYERGIGGLIAYKAGFLDD